MGKKMNNMPVSKKKKDKSNLQIKGKAGLGRKRVGKRLERAVKRQCDLHKQATARQLGLAELARLQEEKARAAEQLDSDGEPVMPRKKKRKKKRHEQQQRPGSDRPVADESDHEEADVRPSNLRKGSVEFREEGSTSMNTHFTSSAASSLQYGTPVSLRGLKGSPELNGKSGTCLSWDGTKMRWHVRLGDGSLKLLRPENLKALVLEEGLAVTIRGLTGAIELNDRPAVCKRWDIGKQRWLVALRGGIEKLLKPENLEVLSTDGAFYVSPTIRQTVQVCTEHAKAEELIQFIKKVRAEEKRGLRVVSLMIVFCSSPERIRSIAGKLAQVQLNCVSLHAEVPKARRDHALRDFHVEGRRILVTADDCTAGLCTRHVRYLFSYDFPGSLDLYCSRLGSLSREGAVAHTFFTRASASLAKELVEVLKQTEDSVDPALISIANSGSE